MKLWKKYPRMYVDKQTCPITGFEFEAKRLRSGAGNTVRVVCPHCKKKHIVRAGSIKE